MNPKKVLICTNQLNIFSGSEILAFDVAKIFRDFGCHVSIHTNSYGPPLSNHYAQEGFRVTIPPHSPNPFDFDIVWSQHNLIPVLIEANVNQPLTYSTLFCFAHLSPYMGLESLGCFAERILAKHIFANSPETRDRLVALGLKEKEVTIFHNAVPAKFRASSLPSESLKRLIVITNHLPNELADATLALRELLGVQCDVFGVKSESFEKIEPEHIAAYDAVVSIGRTVQYAILGNRPVYCCDRFGGPGWLTSANLERAEYFNYSGRCCNRRLSTEQLVTEIYMGYKHAAKYVVPIKEKVMHKYILEQYLARILEEANTKTISASLSQEDIVNITVEAQLMKIIRDLTFRH